MNESTLVPREEMGDLDWLAMNIHKWASGCNLVRRHPDGLNGAWEVSLEYATPREKYFTRDQWLSRRAELQNKPSWKDAPEWAQWLGQDKCGSWLWHKETPKTRISYFDSDGSKESNAGEVLGDWRDTLEKRPDANEMPAHSNQPKPSTDIPECAELKQFEPFVSVEDAKISILQSDGDIKHFGGIIGRNLLPKEDAATAKQTEPKGSGNPILGMVLADLTNRALEGKEKYGEPLLAHNGRNPLWDAYQEALDLAMYIRQAIEEQKQC